MKKLPEQQMKSKDGIILNLLSRKGDYALVSNRTIDGEHLQGFEVHKIAVNKERNAVIDGHKIHFDASESYRSSSAFGVYALHYVNLGLVYIDYPQFKPDNDKILKKLSVLMG